MQRPSLLQEEETLWADFGFSVCDGQPPVELFVTTDGTAPGEDGVDVILDLLSQWDDLILDAAAIILENYSYEHFRRRGVPAERLVCDETPEAMAAALTLTSIHFRSIERGAFQFSFTAPWDDNHSFDVEFDDGAVTGSSVNG